MRMAWRRSRSWVARRSGWAMIPMHAGRPCSDSESELDFPFVRCLFFSAWSCVHLHHRDLPQQSLSSATFGRAKDAGLSRGGDAMMPHLRRHMLCCRPASRAIVSRFLALRSGRCFASLSRLDPSPTWQSARRGAADRGRESSARAYVRRRVYACWQARRATPPPSPSRRRAVWMGWD
jgi:hypothetical protein